MHSHISMIYATSCAYSAGEPIHIKLIYNHLKGVCVVYVRVARCVQVHMLVRFASVTDCNKFGQFFGIMMLARSTLEIHRCSMHWKTTLAREKQVGDSRTSRKCRCPWCSWRRKAGMDGWPTKLLHEGIHGMSVESFIAFIF